MKLIAITGGIATGKSVVSRYLRNLEYPVIDADEIGHKVLDLDNVKKKIIAEFGDLLNKDGKIDRKKLGTIVFSDRNKLQILDSITHPKIVKMIEDEAKKLGKMNDEVFVEAAVLFEMGMDKRVDFIIVTYCPDELRIQRMISRDHLTYEEAMKRLKAQLPASEYLKRADLVIDTSNKVEKTLEQIFDILKKKPWSDKI